MTQRRTPEKNAPHKNGQIRKTGDGLRALYNGSSVLPLDTPPQDDWAVRLANGKIARPALPLDYKGVADCGHLPPRDAAVREDDARHLFAEAVFILSQSDTGRDVLQRAHDAGYAFVFDDRRLGNAAGALCDVASKMIVVSSTHDAAYLALTIAHECVHAVQASVHKLQPTMQHRIEDGLKLTFAIEADAFAQQTAVAFELMNGSPKGPADQITFGEPLYQMQQRFASLVRAGRAVNATLKQGEDSSRIAAAVFEAFYDSHSMRSFYEDEHVQYMRARADASPKWMVQGMRAFSRPVPSADIIGKLMHQGVAYITKHLPRLTLDDARHAGMTAETAAKVRDFYKTHRPHDAAPKINIFGTHSSTVASRRFDDAAGAHVQFVRKHVPKL